MIAVVVIVRNAMSKTEMMCVSTKLFGTNSSFQMDLQKIPSSIGFFDRGLVSTVRTPFFISSIPAIFILGVLKSCAKIQVKRIVTPTVSTITLTKMATLKAFNVFFRKTKMLTQSFSSFSDSIGRITRCGKIAMRLSLFKGIHKISKEVHKKIIQRNHNE